MDRLLASCSCWFCLFVYYVCDQSAIRTAGCACVRPHVANFFFFWWGDDDDDEDIYLKDSPTGTKPWSNFFFFFYWGGVMMMMMMIFI